MTMAQDRPDLDTLTTVIAHSQIVVGRAFRRGRRLPAEFEAVDRDILDWIAAECRLVARGLIRK
jgi:hypothetical protein